ncbi:GDYXXLXY domain-containing protein [Aquimarina sp. AU474]|uniref:GDYXXLXY domain-containing protein n=1 Tax=Aquimarina sp. AU474 TaxID=2108529 RepID=UPI000D6858D9|nr:GDYXXLXY domain-containing protein [Aquimarina sp. AU474]
MKTIHLFIGFMLLVLVQIFIPVQMIWEQEDVLISGEVYKFKTRPIDPTDPFRGKYITLQYEMDSFTKEDTSYAYGDKIRIYIKKDDNGFAVPVAISKKPLTSSKDFILAKVIGNYNKEISFELPFNRFYMEETKAYDAEKAYRKVNRDGLKENVYAEVYVKDGVSVLKNVIIDGIPIQEYVEK